MSLRQRVEPGQRYRHLACQKIRGMQYCWSISYTGGEVTAEKDPELDFHICSYVQASSCFCKSLRLLKGHIEIPKSARSHIESLRLSFLAIEAVGKH